MMMKHDIVVETLSGSISLPDPSDHPAHITVQQMCAKHLRLPIKFVAEHMPEALKMPEGPVEGHSQPIKVQLVLLPARVRDYSIERPPEDVIRIDEGVELRKYLSKSFIYQLTGRGLRETTPCREHWYTRGIRHLGQFHVQILCSPELPRAMAQAKAALDALRWQTYKQNQAQRQQDQQAQRLQGLKRPRNAGVAASQAAVKRARRGGRPVTPVTTALAAAQAGQVFPQTTPSTGDLLKVVQRLKSSVMIAARFVHAHLPNMATQRCGTLQYIPVQLVLLPPAATDITPGLSSHRVINLDDGVTLRRCETMRQREGALPQVVYALGGIALTGSRPFKEGWFLRGIRVLDGGCVQLLCSPTLPPQLQQRIQARDAQRKNTLARNKQKEQQHPKQQQQQQQQHSAVQPAGRSEAPCSKGTAAALQKSATPHAAAPRAADNHSRQQQQRRQSPSSLAKPSTAAGTAYTTAQQQQSRVATAAGRRPGCAIPYTRPPLIECLPLPVGKHLTTSSGRVLAAATRSKPTVDGSREAELVTEPAHTAAAAVSAQAVPVATRVPASKSPAAKAVSHQPAAAAAARRQTPAQQPPPPPPPAAAAGVKASRHQAPKAVQTNARDVASSAGRSVKGLTAEGLLAVNTAAHDAAPQQRPQHPHQQQHTASPTPKPGGTQFTPHTPAATEAAADQGRTADAAELAQTDAGAAMKYRPPPSLPAAGAMAVPGSSNGATHAGGNPAATATPEAAASRQPVSSSTARDLLLLTTKQEAAGTTASGGGGGGAAAAAAAAPPFAAASAVAINSSREQLGRSSSPRGSRLSAAFADGGCHTPEKPVRHSRPWSRYRSQSRSRSRYSSRPKRRSRSRSRSSSRPRGVDRRRYSPGRRGTCRSRSRSRPVHRSRCRSRSRESYPATGRADAGGYSRHPEHYRDRGWRSAANQQQQEMQHQILRLVRILQVELDAQLKHLDVLWRRRRVQGCKQWSGCEGSCPYGHRCKFPYSHIPGKPTQNYLDCQQVYLRFGGVRDRLGRYRVDLERLADQQVKAEQQQQQQLPLQNPPLTPSQGHAGGGGKLGRAPEGTTATSCKHSAAGQKQQQQQEEEEEEELGLLPKHLPQPQDKQQQSTIPVSSAAAPVKLPMMNQLQQQQQHQAVYQCQHQQIEEERDDNSQQQDSKPVEYFAAAAADGCESPQWGPIHRQSPRLQLQHQQQQQQAIAEPQQHQDILYQPEACGAGSPEAAVHPEPVLAAAIPSLHAHMRVVTPSTTGNEQGWQQPAVCVEAAPQAWLPQPQSIMATREMATAAAGAGNISVHGGAVPEAKAAQVAAVGANAAAGAAAAAVLPAAGLAAAAGIDAFTNNNADGSNKWRQQRHMDDKQQEEDRDEPAAATTSLAADKLWVKADPEAAQQQCQQQLIKLDSCSIAGDDHLHLATPSPLAACHHIKPDPLSSQTLPLLPDSHEYVLTDDIYGSILNLLCQLHKAQPGHFDVPECAEQLAQIQDDEVQTRRFMRVGYKVLASAARNDNVGVAVNAVKKYLYPCNK